ncbi:unnamed protein product, partial [Ectocarpus sp. 13 AM-2016]
MGAVGGGGGERVPRASEVDTRMCKRDRRGAGTVPPLLRLLLPNPLRGDGETYRNPTTLVVFLKLDYNDQDSFIHTSTHTPSRDATQHHSYLLSTAPVPPPIPFISA